MHSKGNQRLAMTGITRLFENSTMDFTDNNSNETNYLVNNLAPDSVLTPLYIQVFVGLANAIIFLTGLFGNSLVILVVCRVREMRSSTNYFLISLSAADLLVLLICQPSAILEFYAEERWLLGRTLCKLVPFLENAVAFTSILTLLVISIERFVVVCHPFAAYTTITKKKTAITVFVVWLAAFILSIPFVLLTDQETAYFHDGSLVNVCKTRIDQDWHHVYLLSSCIVLFLIPMLVLIVLYSLILRKLKTESMTIGRRNERRNSQPVIRLLISVVVLFFVCLLPVRVITLWKVYTSTENIKVLQLEGYLSLIWFARLMMYINSAGNPLIYTLVSSKFRTAFKRCLFSRKIFRNSTKRHTDVTSHHCSSINVKDYKEYQRVKCHPSGCQSTGIVGAEADFNCSKC